MSKLYYKVPAPIIKTNKGNHEVTFPVSYNYNGGIVIKGKWYKGYKVPAPIVPKGMVLKGMGIGLNLNYSPPLTTMYLQNKKED